MSNNLNIDIKRIFSARFLSRTFLSCLTLLWQKEKIPKFTFYLTTNNLFNFGLFNTKPCVVLDPGRIFETFPCSCDHLSRVIKIKSMTRRIKSVLPIFYWNQHKLTFLYLQFLVSLSRRLPEDSLALASVLSLSSISARRVHFLQPLLYQHFFSATRIWRFHIKAFKEIGLKKK